MELPRILIIGEGRFGTLLKTILTREAECSSLEILGAPLSFPLSDGERRILETASIIIPAVPIRHFQSVLEHIAPVLGVNQTIVDVCSVKEHPIQVMKSYLSPEVGIVATHPLFGPRTVSERNDNLSGLSVITCPVRDLYSVGERVEQLCKGLGIRTIEMPSEQHDRELAKVQFFTIFSTLLLRDVLPPESEFETESSRAMRQYLALVSVDEEFLRDLYQFNPFTKELLSELRRRFVRLHKKLR